MWGATVGERDEPASLITCRPCIKALTTRNTENRRTAYAVRVSEEQDAFAAGVPVAVATAWRKPWYAGNHDNEGGYPITPRTQS